MSQFVAMAGLHGCLPNFTSDCETFESAVDVLADLHQLGLRRRASLKASGYVELNLGRDGNEYAEIVNGDRRPECHSA